MMNIKKLYYRRNTLNFTKLEYGLNTNRPIYREYIATGVDGVLILVKNGKISSGLWTE